MVHASSDNDVPVKPGFMVRPRAWYAHAMNSGPRIISLETSSGDGAGDAATQPSSDVAATPTYPEPSVEPESWESADVTTGGKSDNVALVLAGCAIAGWTAFFVWANLETMRGGSDPAQVSQWLVQWSVPVTLCLLAVLVVLRTSRREAARFADAARNLRLESERLEGRLLSVNTELSLARDFIAAQSRDLESLGRIAVERLGTTSGRLQDLIAQNGEQVDRIGAVSASAVENMEKLRGQLPVVTNAAKDLTNNIAQAGRTAHVQIEDMVSGFQRLNEFGLASERQVAVIRQKVDEAIAVFGREADHLAQITAERFDGLAAHGDAHRQRLAADEASAFEALRERAEALALELSAQRTAAAAAEAEALEALHARFNALREEGYNLGRTIAAAEESALQSWGDRSAKEVSSLRFALDTLAREHEQSVGDAAERLAGFEQAARSLMALLNDQARNFEEQFNRRRAGVEALAAEQRDDLVRRLDDIDAAITSRREKMTHAGADAADGLAVKLAELDNALDEQRRRQFDETRVLASHCEDIAAKVSALSDTLRGSGEQGAVTAEAVDRALATLNQRLADTRDALSGTDLQIGEVTDSAVRLLELIRAGGDHTRTQIPEALRSTEAGLKGIEDRVFMLRDTLREAGDVGRSLSEGVQDTRATVTGTLEDVGKLHREIAAQAAGHETNTALLRAALASIKAEADALADDIDGRLATAIERVAAAASKVGSTLRDSTAADIAALAERLGDESNSAIARVLQGRAAELIARLEEAIDTAAESGLETAVQMRDQLAKVDELAANLENRVSRARERAQEQVDNDFSRRAALITESLNSTSIDIAKALSSDVSETAWASYLRGDRGIFTRRAVTLLDNVEARAVQQHYETDSEFREHVNRYIHDFESMLRQLLSTRDGNALGVTLLSSDMGKLYVALAQGIERLRT